MTTSNEYFCIVNGDTMNSACASLVERFQVVKTVPSTRSYHQYEPINENIYKVILSLI